MKRRILPFLWSAGAALGLFPLAALAQSGASTFDREIDALFGEPPSVSVLGEESLVSPEVHAPAAFVAPQALPSSAGGCDACSTCQQPASATGCNCGCQDDCWTRQHLFGDLCGNRTCLADHGVLVDLQFTQFYQGVASGGREQTFDYGGKLDYIFTFQGAKLGLNEGFTAIVHAETRYGEDINLDAGAFAFPNVGMLYPFPGTNETAITGLLVMQALSPDFALAGGKLNLLDLWNMLYPNTGRGITGFMNLSLIAPVPIIRTTNLSVNGAGAMALRGKEIQGAVLVYDTNNSSTTVGLDDLFDDGAVVLGYWRFFTELYGLEGSHGFVGNWSSRTFASIDPSSWTIVPGQGLIVNQETGSWTVGYIFDQPLWIDRCDANRNLRLMSQWMIADGNPNFYSWSGNVALQAGGLVPGRNQDTMGVGYFYDGLSSDFKELLSPLVALEDVHGGELYYNAAVTPWFHLTTDLQVIDNQNQNQDTVIAVGLRANIDL